MKKIYAAFGLIAGVFVTGGVHAQVSTTGEMGTTGLGFHASFPLTSDMNARLGMNYIGFNYQGSTKDLKYDLQLKANTYDVLLDWFPARESAFRLTAGVAYNGNQVNVNGKPDQAGNYTLSGNTYSAATVGEVRGKMSFNKISPYLGIGWGKPDANKKGWSFSGDVGVLLQGSPKTSLNSAGCTATAAVCNQFSSDLAKEKSALSDEGGKFKAYPVLRIGVNYSF